MANYPKKMTDPTEAALSAIQEALNLATDEEQAASQPERHGRSSVRRRPGPRPVRLAAAAASDERPANPTPSARAISPDRRRARRQR